MRYITLLFLMFIVTSSTDVSAESIGDYTVISKQRVVRENGNPYWELTVLYRHPDGVTEKTVKERIFDDQVDGSGKTRLDKIRDYLNFRTGRIKALIDKEKISPDGSIIDTVIASGVSDVQNKIVEKKIGDVLVSASSTQQAVLTYKWLDGAETDGTNDATAWETSDVSVATVSNRGLVTGVSEGTARLTATLPGGESVGIIVVTN